MVTLGLVPKTIHKYPSKSIAKNHRQAHGLNRRTHTCCGRIKEQACKIINIMILKHYGKNFIFMQKRIIRLKNGRKRIFLQNLTTKEGQKDIYSHM